MITINGTTGIAGTNGSAGTPAVQGEDTNTGIFFPAADTVAVATGGAERLRVDSAGNLGLGVTPSAWTRKALQIGDAAAAYVANGSGGATVIATNMFFDGANKYATTAAAARYSVGSGNHEWYIAPSGTAGNSISFTQAMTLDSSGNLLVGTTSAGYSAAGRGLLEVNGSSTALIGLKTGGTNRGYLYTQGTDMIAWAETGNFTVGTAASAVVAFTTSNTERARIDSSGNLLVGTTSASCGGTTMRQHVSATDFCLGLTTAASGNTQALRFAYGTTAVGSVTLTGSTTSYNTSSDYRLKENVAPMQNALDTVAQLNPVTYTWKADGSAGQGFIAHELQAVVPDCVTGEKDAVDAEGNPQYQGVDTSFLVATLVKAIQELTARVAELEAK